MPIHRITFNRLSQLKRKLAQSILRSFRNTEVKNMYKTALWPKIMPIGSERSTVIQRQSALTHLPLRFIMATCT